MGAKVKAERCEGQSHWQGRQEGASQNTVFPPWHHSSLHIRNWALSPTIPRCCLAKTVWLNLAHEQLERAAIWWFWSEVSLKFLSGKLFFCLRAYFHKGSITGWPSNRATIYFIIQVRTLLRGKWSIINNYKGKTWVNGVSPDKSTGRSTYISTQSQGQEKILPKPTHLFQNLLEELMYSSTILSFVFPQRVLHILPSVCICLPIILNHLAFPQVFQYWIYLWRWIWKQNGYF